MEILFAIWSFAYLFNLLPVGTNAKLVVCILALVLLVLAVVGMPMIHAKT